MQIIKFLLSLNANLINPLKIQLEYTHNKSQDKNSMTQSRS